MKKTNQRQKPSVAPVEEQVPTKIADLAANPQTIEQDALSHIREAAYHKWELAGRPASDGTEFWLDAEREYLAAHAMPDPSGTNDVVQEASEESFPASDPPARTISLAPATHSTVTAS
jgi:hypothetical protein